MTLRGQFSGVSGWTVRRRGGDEGGAVGADTSLMALAEKSWGETGRHRSFVFVLTLEKYKRDYVLI